MRQWIALAASKLTSRRNQSSATPVKVRRAAPGNIERRADCSMESLEDRTVFSSSLTHGIALTTLSSKNYNAILNMLHDTGTTTVRAWVSVKSWGSRSEDGTWKYFRKLHSAGIDFVISVVPNSRGSASQVSSYFNWLAGKLGGVSNKWEVGNEVDRGTYSGRLGDYVNQLLKPAASALHSHGIKVISGSVSWNPDDIKTMVNAGMLNYVDYVGYHPYRNNVAQLQQAIADVKSYVKGKPLVATEWNARGQSGTAWANMIAAFWPYIRDNFYAAYYYASQKASTMAGAAGVLTGNSGGHNGVFYTTYKGLRAGSGASVSASASSTPTVSLPSTAVSASSGTKTTTTSSVKTSTGAASVKATTPPKTTTAAPTPAVSYFRILDANTGKVLSGFDHITASETIKLKALPTRYIQIEAVSSNVESVKFTFSGRTDHTENTAAYTAFVDKHGKYTGWEAGVGSYTLTATGYAKDFASGTASKKLGIVLAFR